MIRMFVRHPVNDFQTWKQSYDAFDTERTGMGVVADEVYQSAEDPNDVTVWHDFESIEAARSFVESGVLRNKMDEAGVAGEPQIWFTERAR